MDLHDHSAESARVPKFPTDLDDLRSTDKCPMCFSQTHRASSCPTCGLNLHDSRLAEVFTQSTIAADALVARGNLLAKAWRDSTAAPTPTPPVLQPAVVPVPEPAGARPTVPVVPTQPHASAWAEARPQVVPVPSQPTGQAQDQADPIHPPAQAPSEPQKPRRSGIQLTLLILGVSFVSIAAIVFLTVAFVLFDLVVKSIITAGVTAGVIALASLLKRKQLTTTAEGVAILGVVLLLLDLWAIRSLNLLGLGQIQGTLFWGVGLLVMTGILLGWGKLASLRAPRIASTFTIGPGIVAMLRWIFDWVFTDHSATLIALAGLAIASVLAPILHKREDRPDALEVGIVFGIGQIGALALAFQALGSTFASSANAGSASASAPHPLEEPIVAIVTAGIGIAALLWHLRHLRIHDSLFAIRWLRISATILATVLWTTAVLVAATEIFTATTGSFNASEVWKAFPFIALAAVFWDRNYLRTQREDRPRWLTGVITTAAIVVPPVIWLLTVLVMLPLLRAASSNPWDYGTEWPLLGAGIALVLASAVAFFTYRALDEDTRGFARRRLIGSAITAAIGVTISAIALPLWAALVVLGLLLAGTVIGIAVLCRNGASPLRTILLTAYASAAVGLVLVSFPHRPLVIFIFAAVGLGFLMIRLLLGAHGPILITLAAALFAALTTATAWAPIDFPFIAVIFAPALPVVLLLVGAATQRLEVSDRRVLTWAGAILLFLAAAQQFPLAFARLGEPFRDTMWPTFLGAIIAAIAIIALLLVTYRAARTDTADTLTQSVALTAAMPLGYVVMSPFVQLLAEVTGAPMREVMLVWALVTGAVLVVAFLTLTRLRSVPERWTRPADCLTVIAAFLAMLNLIGVDLLSEPRLTGWAVLALALAIAVPLTVAVRSAGQIERGCFRGTFPWIAAGFLALFGPVLVQRLVEDPWPVFLTAPIVLALLISALVFGTSGAAARADHGNWLLGGMLALGCSLPLATLLGSREVIFNDLAWPVSAAAAVLSMATAAACAFWRSNPLLAPARYLLVTITAPLGAMSLITTVSDVLETMANDGSLTADVIGYALAVGIGFAVWLGLTLVSRGLSVSADPLSAHGLDRARLASAANPTAAAKFEISPGHVLAVLGSSATVLVGFAALMLPPQPIDVALAAWAIALALVLIPTRFDWTVFGGAVRSAFMQRVFTAIAVAVAAIAGLVATTTGMQFERLAVAIGSTALGLFLAVVLFVDARRNARSLPSHPTAQSTVSAYRTLTVALIPVAAWAGLMTAPVAWSWWMLVVAAVIALTASLGVAFFRRRFDVPALAAAGVSALLPLATAIAVSDETIRVWPFTWFIVGVSLIAFGFAITHVLAAVLRGFGVVLALVASAILLWPQDPTTAVLLVAIPGCVVLVAMAITGTITNAHAAVANRLEAGLYALAAPVWFVGIAVTASSVIAGETFAIIMIVMLCISVGAIAGFWFTETQHTEFHLPLQMLAGGSGLSAIVAFLAAIQKESNTPGDLYFLAFGLALTAVGSLWLRARPALRSFPALGPGLAVMLVPLWFYEANDPTATRIGTYTVLVLTAVLIGALGKLQAPLVLGTIAAVAHLIVALRWMLPELSVPWWIWLGAAGALLIFVAATYEARLKNAKAVVTSISQLR